MRFFQTILPALLLPALALAGGYGEPVPQSDESVGVAEAIAGADALEGKALVLEGRITQVCRKRGCWAVFTEDEHFIRVMAEDHAFAMPADYNGLARAHGLLQREPLSEDHVEHLIAEDGADLRLRDDPVEYRLIASGVELLAE